MRVHSCSARLEKWLVRSANEGVISSRAFYCDCPTGASALSVVVGALYGRFATRLRGCRTEVVGARFSASQRAKASEPVEAGFSPATKRSEGIVPPSEPTAPLEFAYHFLYPVPAPGCANPKKSFPSFWPPAVPQSSLFPKPWLSSAKEPPCKSP